MGVYVSSYSTDYLDDAVNYFKKDDLLLIFSAGGDSTYIRKITNLKCKTLLVTANPNAKYRKHFDKVITLPTLSGDWNMIPFPQLCLTSSQNSLSHIMANK